MAHDSVIRVPVAEVEEILATLQLAQGKTDLNSRQRRSLGLAIDALSKVRRRSRGSWVSLSKADILRILRCLAQLSAHINELWVRYFVQEI